MSGVPTFQRFAARLGMASVILALTLAFAFLKRGLVARSRKLLPRVRFASAILLVVAGAYLILYWWPFLTRSAPFG